MGDAAKMYICLEASDEKKFKNHYMICSIRLSDLTGQLSDNAVPHFHLERKFQGYPSMGCGLFGSKIVFTGGKTKRNGFTTFDFATREFSRNSLPQMRCSKAKPLVFELNKRLYVFDVSSCFYDGAFEYFNPSEHRWYNLLLPHDAPSDCCRYSHGIPQNAHHDYSFLIFGSTCYFHIPPYDDTLIFFHHPSYTHQTWLTFPRTHPFSGASAVYLQYNFFDSVVFSFENRLVRAHRFSVLSCYFEDPILLFEVEPSSESNGNMSAYFVDLQGGIFILTAYDNVCIYFHTFKVYRTGEESSPMTINCNVMSKYQIKFNSLPLGSRMLGVVGCFSSSPNTEAIKYADEVFGSCMLRFAKRCDNDSRMVEIDGKPCVAPQGPRGEMVWHSGPDGTRCLVVT
ncbi:hypothetical protein POM88_007371 [Heracleum sosnowskyi]|uniref:Uncharacterized protein n=1 Tax=Heracleum sosnowskyi TaxID=360622 RepID=A0AAD8J599_9APIA|nr:hypothetical protein POM88_007371 [Heracleum sosnowskyi]